MIEQTQRYDQPLTGDIASAIAELRRHYQQIIVPMWRSTGFDRSFLLPAESLSAHHGAISSLPHQRFRAMACARQLYVFSEVGDREHADVLFQSLVRYFKDSRSGGFVYSIDATGKPLDTNKDLYTHAFVIFAASAYFKNFGVNTALELINETMDVVAQRFPTDLATGLPVASVSSDFTQVLISPRQNPLMHLTEAYLAAGQVCAESVENSKNAPLRTRCDSALARLLPLIATAFLDEPSGCILELPQVSDDAWIEPGHQFEWFYLSSASAHPAFTSSGLDRALVRAFDFAQEYGVDDHTGGVAASIDRHGRVLDETQRIWAQTEYLRALACHPSAAQNARLLTQIQLFTQRFLRAEGWHEAVGVDGTVVRADMPSTTPYHLATGYYSLP